MLHLVQKMNRRVIFWLLFVAFFWIIVTRLVQIENLFKTLQRGQGQWLILAALLQLGFYLAYSAIYQSAFHSVGMSKHGLLHLLPLSFAAIFVNVVAPSGGAAGAALFVDDAKRRGASPARAAAGVLVKTLADFTAITLVLAAGMAYLFSRGSLKNYQVAGAMLFLLFLSGLAAMLMLSIWKPDALCSLLKGLQKLLDRVWLRIKHRPALSADWAEHNTAELVRASRALTQHPTRPGRAFLISVGSHLLNMASLYAIFRAFQHPVEAGAVVAGYAMALLFLIVSITPMGIGVVEGMMVLAFQSLGIPGTTSAVVALSFRGLGFWLPFLIGFMVLRRLRAFSA